MTDGAVWNRGKTLAEACPVSPHRRAMLTRIERNKRDRGYAKTEDAQLTWQPAPGRVAYAGRETDE